MVMMAVLAGAWMVGLAIFRRDTWLGRELHRVLVEVPAQSLNRGPIVVIAQVVALMVLYSVAFTAPELMVIAGTVDLALFVELGAILLVTRAGGWMRNSRTLVAYARDVVSNRLRSLRIGPRRTSRAPRTRKPRKLPPKHGEPDQSWAPMFA